MFAALLAVCPIELLAESGEVSYQREDLVTQADAAPAPAPSAEGDAAAPVQPDAQPAGEAAAPGGNTTTKSKQDKAVEVVIERSIEPKAARLDYEFDLTLGYDDNPAGLSGNSVLGDARNTAEPQGSFDTVQSGRVIYRLVGDADNGLSIRGDVDLEQYASLHDFDTRQYTAGLTGYRAVGEKLRLTGDLSYSAINFDKQHLVDVKSALGEVAWQHNDLHRSIFDVSIARREFVLPSSEEFDEDGYIYSLQARHDWGVDVLGRRAVLIGLVSWGRDETQGDSSRNEFVAGTSQVLYVLSPQFIFDVSYSYRTNDYDNPNQLTEFQRKRRDITRGYSAGLRWLPSDAINVRAGVSGLNVDSNLPDFYTFDRNFGGVTIEYRGEK